MRYWIAALFVMAALATTRSLLAADTQPLWSFGMAVAISGQRALVGSFQPNDAQPIRKIVGGAYLFERSGSTWSQSTKLSGTTQTVCPTWFGYGVALKGRRPGGSHVEPTG